MTAAVRGHTLERGSGGMSGCMAYPPRAPAVSYRPHAGRSAFHIRRQALRPASRATRWHPPCWPMACGWSAARSSIIRPRGILLAPAVRRAECTRRVAQWRAARTEHPCHHGIELYDGLESASARTAGRRCAFDLLSMATRRCRRCSWARASTTRPSCGPRPVLGENLRAADPPRGGPRPCGLASRIRITTRKAYLPFAMCW